MHSNITTERTRYKAHPSWYGRQPDGSLYYWVEVDADDADQAAKKRKPTAFTDEQLRAMAPKPNKAMQQPIANLAKRTCLECGTAFQPASPSQVVCGPECKRVRLNRQNGQSKKRRAA